MERHKEKKKASFLKKAASSICAWQQSWVNNNKNLFLFISPPIYNRTREKILLLFKKHRIVFSNGCAQFFKFFHNTKYCTWYIYCNVWYLCILNTVTFLCFKILINNQEYYFFAWDLNLLFGKSKPIYVFDFSPETRLFCDLQWICHCQMAFSADQPTAQMLED